MQRSNERTPIAVVDTSYYAKSHDFNCRKIPFGVHQKQKLYFFYHTQHAHERMEATRRNIIENKTFSTHILIRNGNRKNTLAQTALVQRHLSSLATFSALARQIWEKHEKEFFGPSVQFQPMTGCYEYRTSAFATHRSIEASILEQFGRHWRHYQNTRNNF